MENKSIQLTATNIRYLLAIHKLSSEGRFIRCTDIARAISVTRPSVHAMIKTFSDLKLIEKPHYGKVTFTRKGTELSCTYLECYKILSAWFSSVLAEGADSDSLICAFMSQMPVGMLVNTCRNIENKNI